VDIKDVLSKEKIVNAVRNLGKLRIKTDHDSLLTMSALALILFVAFTIRILPLRWEIQTGSIHLNEFDPYFHYRLTQYMVKNGFISWAWPTHWIDKQSWYPFGLDYADAGYPGLTMTGALLYDVVTTLGVSISLMEFVALLMPFFGALACFVTYLLGKDMGGKPVGLLAALFTALAPTFIERSDLGWYKHEPIGIFSLVLLAFLFLRAIEEDRPMNSVVKYSLGAGLVCGYLFAGWGASYYGLDLMVLFTFILILLKKYTQRLFLSYSLTLGIGLFIAINVPRIGLGYLSTSVALPAAGVFLLLCLSEVFRGLPSTRRRVIFIIVSLGLIVASFAALWQLGYMGSVAGKFVSVIDPYLRGASEILNSVAEHRIAAWGSLYYEFGIGILFFLAGLYFILKDLNNRNVFLLVFSLTALYFASSMVRLFVIMAPAFGLLAAAGTMGILKPFITLLKEPPRISMKRRFSQEHVGKEFSGLAVVLIFLILMTDLAFPMPKVYSQAYTPVSITAASLPIIPNVPVSQWLDMLQWTQNNLESTTVVCSWWDYGYWLTIQGNVTTLADNATINTTQIENIGFIYMANETQALKMLKVYNASYILVFTTFSYQGSWVGYGDEGKWMWMARISGGAHDRFVYTKFIDESHAWYNETTFGYYNSTQNKWIWNARGTNSTIYKLMGWAKNQWCSAQSVADPDAASVSKPRYFDEAFFSGKTLSVSNAQSYYGGIVPMVALYKIDWALYDADYPNQ
jgi:dolichyl-diphosphooligosaccharide--protein glycosyltransferase